MLKWKCHRKIHGQHSNWGAKVKEEVGQFWSLAILQFCREFYKTGHISPILSPADSPPSKTNLGQEIKSILIKTTNTDFRSRPPSLIYFVKFSLYHALIYIRYFMIPLTQPHSWYESQPAVVYFFPAVLLFSIEDAKFWPVLAKFDYFVANIQTFCRIFYRPI